MRQPWRSLLIGTVLGIAAFAWMPSGGARVVVYLAVAIASLTLAIRALNGGPGRAALGWAVVGIALGCYVAGDIVSAVYGEVLGRPTDSPTPADVLAMAGTTCLLTAIWIISRRRGLAASRERYADGGIVCIGLFTVAWEVLVSGYIRDPGLSAGAKAAAVSYTLLDLGLLFVLACALLADVVRRPAEQFLMAGFAALIVGDILYASLDEHDSANFTGASGAFRLAAYALIAAAVVHPSSQQPLEVHPDSDLRLRVWVPLVAAAGFITPTMLLLSTVYGFHIDVAVFAAASLALFGLVVLRVCWLFNRIRNQNQLLQAHTRSLESALMAQRVLRTDLAHNSLHDGLTGLPNRALLRDRCEYALTLARQSSDSVVLYICDMDGFQAINDSRGHLVGDELLVIASRRLAAVTRAGDIVARLEGDEFAVLLTNVSDTAMATGLAERIVTVLRQPAIVGDESISLSVSVGVAFAEPSSTAEQLLSDADTAMYEAKTAGRDRFAVFEDAMRTRLMDQLAITSSFQGAVQRDEFFLEFEPQVRLSDGELQGFEALVRWQHPTLGRLSPERFIRHAEESGFIQRLGRWVLERACVEAASWAPPPGRTLSVSVNISGRQLQHPSLVEEVWTALSVSGLRPHLLTLEITESVLMLNPTGAAQILNELKEMGVRVAIDDFGTGYSSLSHLRQFPVDILKVDRSFIEPLTDPTSEGTAFVETIVRLARGLNMNTIAEGIESTEQLDTLRRLGCDQAQGYLLSRPMSRDATADFILQSSAMPAT